MTPVLPAPPLDEAFPLEGGWLCLGFCNTVGWHSGAYRRADVPDGEHTWELSKDWPGSQERFSDYRALLRWFLRKRQVTVAEAKRLLRLARANPEEADRVRRLAVALRETLYHIFSALSVEQDPDPRDVHALNEVLPLALSHRRLVYTGAAHRPDDSGSPFAWQPAAPPVDLARLLWPVLWSAAELLTTGPLQRVRECDNDPCGWLFVDMSRNRSRRWCDMRDCGNRVKARRHHQRVKATLA
jgi:predicted RNA-binding Zn ribbon-like protein